MQVRHSVFPVWPSFKGRQAPISQRQAVSEDVFVRRPAAQVLKFGAQQEMRVISEAPKVVSVENFLPQKEWKALQSFCAKRASQKEVLEADEVDERQKINGGYIYLKRDADGQFRMDPTRWENAPGAIHIVDPEIHDVVGILAEKFVKTVNLKFPELLEDRNALAIDLFVTRYSPDKPDKSDGKAPVLERHQDGRGTLAVMSYLVKDAYSGGAFLIDELDNISVFGKVLDPKKTFRHRQKANEAIVFSDQSNVHSVDRMSGLREVVTMSLKPDYA